MSSLGNFVWSIADQLRGVYKPSDYGDVILPMTILRRLDCILADTREEVRVLASQQSNPELLAALVKAKFGLNFYNTSEWTMRKLLSDPEGLAVNLVDFTNRFSANIDVFSRFEFEKEVARLEEKNRLYLVVQKFAEIDLHPDVVPNAEMGDLFEELIRRFSEAANETAGEHYTPRDAIRLMVDLLFAEDNDALLEPGIVRTVYDPTAGTGGMLSVAEDYLLSLNPQSRLGLYGQEIYDKSYAICKSDMIAKGQDATNIRLGDTLMEDLHFGRTFDYCMSNPPYGVDWKAAEESVKAERAATGDAGRFPGGLPAIGDGQMLFLQHLVSKMRPVHEGGGRAGVVLNGSPLFNGAAGSGPSEIRRWLLEHDLVEAIVALPTNMFYNTGISTYIWILDNTKAPERRGKVQLIDGSTLFVKMRKNLGAKSREVSDADRARILTVYDAFDEQTPENEALSRVFANTDFGYWTVSVEQPIAMRYVVDAAALNWVREAFPPDGETVPVRVVESLKGQEYADVDALKKALPAAAKTLGEKLATPAIRDLVRAIGRPVDESASVSYSGASLTPTPIKDTENIPFGWAAPGETGDSEWGRDNPDALIAAYVEAEVLPHVPSARVDEAKTKAGYEIPFTRHFYTYTPPRPLEEIDADLNVLAKEIIALLQEIEA